MRVVILSLLLALAGCAALPPTSVETDYADALIARAAVPAPVVVEAPSAVEAPPSEPATPREAAEAPPVESRHQRLAGNETALTGFLAASFSADDLAALAVLRSDAMSAARAKLEAARTGYRQAADLDDLAAIYRSYSRDLDTRVGPPRHRRPAAALAPSPNVTALSGEVVVKTVAIARQNLRSVELSVTADALRAHAEVAHWAESRRVVTEDVRLLDGLARVMRVKLEAGQADQAGYLALTSRVAMRRTELEVLFAKAPALRARLNRQLARDENAPVSLDLDPAPPAGPIDDGAAVVARALTENPAMKTAVLKAERAAIGVRLAETMTLPRMDIGSSRYERERTGEAGVDRGPVFPDPGKMIMPRADFGVREAQVVEMRARADALAAAKKETARRTADAVRRGLFAVTASRRRLTTLTETVVPKAAQALRAARGAYEGNRSGYLDLLEAARRHIAARLDRAGARRDLEMARADLLVAAGFDPGKGSDR